MRAHQDSPDEALLALIEIRLLDPMNHLVCQHGHVHGARLFDLN